MTIQDVRATSDFAERRLLKAVPAQRVTSLPVSERIFTDEVQIGPRGARPSRVRVGEVEFDALTEQEVIAHVMSALIAGLGGCIITPNVDILRQARSAELRELIASADLVVPDGMPIIWASRAQGCPLPERVTGSSLAWTLTAAAANAGHSVFLLGGAASTAERAGERLLADVPGLDLAGTYCPPFGFEENPEQLEATLRAVIDPAPNVVFVALGFPKQEKIMMKLRAALPHTWFIGCGGALAMVAGEVDRAPAWAQQHGLEWAHRLLKEPRRLARRYLLEGLPFASGLMVRAIAARASVAKPASGFAASSLTAVR